MKFIKLCFNEILMLLLEKTFFIGKMKKILICFLRLWTINLTISRASWESRVIEII